MYIVMNIFQIYYIFVLITTNEMPYLLWFTYYELPLIIIYVIIQRSVVFFKNARLILIESPRKFILNIMYLTLIYIYVLYFSASFKITYSKFLVFKIKANFLNEKIVIPTTHP